MPRFKPLTINRQEDTTTNTGIRLRILALTPTLIHCEAVVTKAIAGKVPRPNNAINAAPLSISPVAIEPATAR